MKIIAIPKCGKKSYGKIYRSLFPKAISFPNGILCSQTGMMGPNDDDI